MERVGERYVKESKGKEKRKVLEGREKRKNCKVIPGEECLTQHKLLCCDFEIKNMKMPKIQKGEKRIKMWKLKN